MKISEAVFIIIVILWTIIGAIITGQLIDKGNKVGNEGIKETEMTFIGNVSPNDLNFSSPSPIKNLFEITEVLDYKAILEVKSYNGTVTMRVYPNGTVWIKEGYGAYNGEELAKFTIAFGAYQKGYCQGLLEVKA